MNSGDKDRERLYNPYEFMQTGDGYRISSSPEFLFEKEALKKRRSAGESAQYYAGSGYLGGALLGGAKGIFDGFRAREAGDSLKIRANRVINASGHAGRSLGNKMGVLGLLYAGAEGVTYHLRGTDDFLNPIIAGLGTGVLYKAAGGPRTAAIAGALGGIAAAGIVAGRNISKSNSNNS